MKTITIPNLEDALYYKVLGLKAKLQTETWIDFLEKVTEKDSAISKETEAMFEKMRADTNKSPDDFLKELLDLYGAVEITHTLKVISQ